MCSDSVTYISPLIEKVATIIPPLNALMYMSSQHGNVSVVCGRMFPAIEQQIIRLLMVTSWKLLILKNIALFL